MIFFIFLFIAGSILRGYHALKFAVSNTRNLERPDLIVATNMRKMMACVTQVSYCAYHRKCYPSVIYFFISFPLTGTSISQNKNENTPTKCNAELKHGVKHIDFQTYDVRKNVLI
jgi:hypothetical protein